MDLVQIREPHFWLGEFEKILKCAFVASHKNLQIISIIAGIMEGELGVWRVELVERCGEDSPKVLSYSGFHSRSRGVNPHLLTDVCFIFL